MDPLSEENKEQKLEGFGKWMHKGNQAQLINTEDKSIVNTVIFIHRWWNWWINQERAGKEREQKYLEENRIGEDLIQSQNLGLEILLRLHLYLRRKVNLIFLVLLDQRNLQRN